MKIIAIYPGRFQPFGPHHKEAFKWLQQQFGTSNTYIVTSDKVAPPKSPLNFEEKRVLMTRAGVPSSQIVKVKNPYRSDELISKFDKESTAVVFMYGEKDAGRIGYTKKDGTPGYFQKYPGKDKLLPLSQHGYVVVAPNVSINIPGFGEMSGTKLRAFIPQASPQDFKNLFGWYDEKLHSFLSQKFGAMNEVSIITGKQSVDDGPRFFYGDVQSYKNSLNDPSKKPKDWEVANWILGDVTALEKFATDWPNGPVPTVSFFPTGIPGKDSSGYGTSYYKDLRGNPAFKKWMEFAKKISNRDEFYIIDDLDADYSIEDSKIVIKESLDDVSPEVRAKLGGLEKFLKKGYDKKTERNGIVYLYVDLNKQAGNFWDIYGEIYAFDKKTGEKVGSVGVGRAKPTDPFHGSMDVLSSYRRRGIATFMYDWAEKIYGVELEPEDRNSPYAQKFWKNRKVKKGLSEGISRGQLKRIEDYADKLFAAIGVDVDLAKKHFFQRLNDPRNQKDITQEELRNLLKATFQRHKGEIDGMDPGAQAVIKSMTTDINMPFVIQWDRLNQEFDLIAKTIMRKRGFKTSNKVLKVERIEKVGNKWVVYPKKGGNRLGTHDTKEDALAQLRAIEASKNEVAQSIFPNSELKMFGDKGMLTEGGGAGHMSHVIEDDEMTFGDLKEIIKRALEGKLDIESNVTEKTDGMNLLVTYQDGQVKAARNRTTIKVPMSIQSVSDKFQGRGNIHDAFVFAMEDLEKALKAIGEDKLEKLFKNGRVFANLEVIYPENSMTINYGPNAYLQIHGLIEFDENAKKLKTYPDAGATLQKMISKVNADIQKNYTVIPPQVLNMNKHPEAERKMKRYTSTLNRLQQQFGLNDGDTISEYYLRYWKNFIKKYFKVEDGAVLEGLATRWAGINKSFRLNGKNIPDANLLNKVKSFEASKAADIQADNVEKFEDLILAMSLDVMDSATNFLAANPDEEIQKIRQQLASSIRTIRASGDPEDLKKLKKQVGKMRKLGGFKNIVPSEGLVFMYKGKLYKLTGTFIPVHRIMSLVKFKNESIITEGGNVAGVNSLVPREYLETTVQNGLEIFGFRGLDFDVVGNKNKTFLGDVDIAVDSEELAELMGFGAETFWVDLSDYLKRQGGEYKIVKGLSQFHLVVPVVDTNNIQQNQITDREGTEGPEPGKAQIDIMLGDLNWMRNALSGAEESQYKAVYRNLLFVEMLSKIIFNTKNPEIKRKLQINWKKGVQVIDFRTNKKGKREKLKTIKLYGDMDKFVRFVFDKNTRFSDVNNFEKAWDMFMGNRFRFPKYRNDIIDSFKTTLTRMKLPLPSEIQ